MRKRVEMGVRMRMSRVVKNKMMDSTAFHREGNIHCQVAACFSSCQGLRGRLYRGTDRNEMSMSYMTWGLRKRNKTSYIMYLYHA